MKVLIFLAFLVDTSAETRTRVGTQSDKFGLKLVLWEHELYINSPVPVTQLVNGGLVCCNWW